MFHPVSLFIPLLILLPNLLFIKWKPRNIPVETAKSPILTAAEGIGRMGVIVVPLFFSIHIEEPYERISFIGLLLSLSIYYLGWIRYYLKRRDYRFLFSPMMGIPVPLAVTPGLYFMFAAVILHSYYLFFFSVILALGHIPNSLVDYQQSGKTK